jgi:protein-S-isoprenylcysteine O-methyltransferase Ste14
MRVIVAVIGIMWVAFWVYWLASALSAKASRGQSGRLLGARVLIVVVLIALIRAGALGRHAGVTHSLLLAIIGLVVVVAGLGLAVWARIYLGRNWGMPMTQRVEPELVTTGPYRYVRHPIYTGIITALIGTALAVSVYALIPVVVGGAYFVYSARTEERFLASQFPNSYPPYQNSTKMLIPFVF